MHMLLLKSFVTSYLQRTLLIMGSNVGKPQNQDGHITNQFETMAALRVWLIEQGIDVNMWGQGSTKSLEDLWHELICGDSCLQLKPPMRRVHVAQVLIWKHGRILIESVQEFGSGRRRFRNQVPSEKMKTGESYYQAATRCLQEELGISSGQIVFKELTYSEVEVMTDSPSYPVLPSQYIFHRIEAEVRGLPDENFWHENVSYLDGDPIKRHFWAWQKSTGNAPGFPALH